jgi:hypothetical protein
MPQEPSVTFITKKSPVAGAQFSGFVRGSGGKPLWEGVGDREAETGLLSGAGGSA